NMLRSYGKGVAFLTIIGDMLKVFAAIYISILIFGYVPITLNELGDNIFSSIDINMFLKSFAGFFCVLGHIFPCYFRFKGGKGVATSGGMVFAIDWRIALILLAVFIIIVMLSKYVSLGSIVMALLYPLFIYIFHKNLVLTLIAAVFTVIVVVAHRENIKKLFNHTESKISFKSKKKGSV
ncbi:MAG: glycerol-3-phosphate acyltransferase, partial [Eubacterium sp.]|nr:glycerol-3-phosphate acyltransferase [Eubacterium sp.]